MTRINVVPVEELSDQHLIAEYRELPRAVKQNFDLTDAPKKYTLGKGHVKWAAQHPGFLINRFYNLCNEMKYRGFIVNFSSSDFNNLVYENKMKLLIEGPVYILSNDDIQINRQRLIEKYKLKPNYYKWTRRKKPEWLN